MRSKLTHAIWLSPHRFGQWDQSWYMLSGLRLVISRLCFACVGLDSFALRTICRSMQWQVSKPQRDVCEAALDNRVGKDSCRLAHRFPGSISASPSGDVVLAVVWSPGLTAEGAAMDGHSQRDRRRRVHHELDFCVWLLSDRAGATPAPRKLESQQLPRGCRHRMEGAL